MPPSDPTPPDPKQPAAKPAAPAPKPPPKPPPPKYDPLAKLRARELAKRLGAMTPDPGASPLPERAGADVEADDKAELQAVRAALKASDQAVKDVSGENFHCTLVFLTESQLKAFLQATGWGSLCIEDGRYLDGVALAERMGVPLPPVRPRSIRPGQTDTSAVKALGLIDGYPT